MKDDAFSVLAELAIGHAISGFCQMAAKNGKTEYDKAAAVAALKPVVKAKLNEALDDVADAMRAGMQSVAATTFAVSMRLAGIEAARQFFNLPQDANAEGAA